MDKAKARAAVWTDLYQVAKPDSRFHLDFNEYIPDFEGSQAATARLAVLDWLGPGQGGPFGDARDGTIWPGR